MFYQMKRYAQLLFFCLFKTGCTLGICLLISYGWAEEYSHPIFKMSTLLTEYTKIKVGEQGWSSMQRYCVPIEPSCLAKQTVAQQKELCIQKHINLEFFPNFISQRLTFAENLFSNDAFCLNRSMRRVAQSALPVDDVDTHRTVQRYLAAERLHKKYLEEKLPYEQVDDWMISVEVLEEERNASLKKILEDKLREENSLYSQERHKPLYERWRDCNTNPAEFGCNAYLCTSGSGLNAPGCQPANSINLKGLFE